MDLKHADYKISFRKVQKSFISSMMTVVDEQKNISKYENLYFVEFLEFICRIAICGITMTDLIEYKVHLLLEIIYSWFYKIGIMTQNDFPLKEVDEKYIFD